MSAERYVTDLIRLHAAVVRCREKVSGSGHGRCSILHEMVQRIGKDGCMNHEPILPLYRPFIGARKRIGCVKHFASSGAVEFHLGGPPAALVETEVHSKS